MRRLGTERRTGLAAERAPSGPPVDFGRHPSGVSSERSELVAVLLADLARMIATEEENLRDRRAGKVEAVSRLEALQIAQRAVRSAEAEISRLYRITIELKSRSRICERKARRALGTRRTALKCRAATFQVTAAMCRRQAEQVFGQAAVGAGPVARP